MEFLSGKKIFDQVENLICQTDKQLRIAVSYWGIEVMDKTGLLGRIQEKSDSVRVICDLLSPGCNPEPIKQLKDLGVDVRTLDKFHAKVWFCGSDVIVGSPNFSKNGLGYDEKSLLSNNVEAAVHVRNKSFAKLVEAWFEEQWNKSDEVTDEKISEARSRKNQRNDAEREASSKERKRQREQRRENLNKELRQLAKLPFESGQRREEFFRLLLSALRKEKFKQAKNVNPRPNSQISFRSNHTRSKLKQNGIRYFVRVASSNQTSVELNIDIKKQTLSKKEKKAWNEQKFKEIKHEQEAIEQSLHETLKWELKPTKQLSCVAAFKDNTIHDEDADPQEILLWIVEKLIDFDKTFKQFQDVYE